MSAFRKIAYGGGTVPIAIGSAWDKGYCYGSVIYNYWDCYFHINKNELILFKKGTVQKWGNVYD